jgi:hypothetical protein
MCTLFGDTKKTFDQDLELFCARWSDPEKKGEDALSDGEIAAGLIGKADELDRRRKGLK